MSSVDIALVIEALVHYIEGNKLVSISLVKSSSCSGCRSTLKMVNYINKCLYAGLYAWLSCATKNNLFSIIVAWV